MVITLLHLSAERNGNMDMVKTLVENGVKPNIKNNDGKYLTK